VGSSLISLLDLFGICPEFWYLLKEAGRGYLNYRRTRWNVQKYWIECHSWDFSGVK